MLAYGEEMELMKDNVKVIWENIGEKQMILHIVQ